MCLEIAIYYARIIFAQELKKPVFFNTKKKVGIGIVKIFDFRVFGGLHLLRCPELDSTVVFNAFQFFFFFFFLGVGGCILRSNVQILLKVWHKFMPLGLEIGFRCVSLCKRCCYAGSQFRSRYRQVAIISWGLGDQN